MITNETKQYLVEKTAEALVNCNGQLLYSDMNIACSGHSGYNEYQLAIFCLASTVIVHNIPIYSAGTRILRDISNCWHNADVFRITRNDENLLFEISQSTDGFNKYRRYGTFDIGKLSFRDSKPEIFMSGKGSDVCDFIDEFGNKIEVKYKYFRESKSSPATLHDADYLLSYNDYDAELYKVTNGRVLLNGELIALYCGIVSPRRHITEVAGIGEELMNIIRSGELIPAIEERIKAIKPDFKWND